MTTTAPDARALATADPPLPLFRVNLMRTGYLLMVVGLALVKWPLFFRDGGVAALPVFEGAVAALLTAMSLLALVGLRHPLTMLPVLVLESLWKLIWLAAVAVPHLLAGDVDTQLGSMLFSMSFVVVILAVTPWDHVWRRYVRAPGSPWRVR